MRALYPEPSQGLDLAVRHFGSAVGISSVAPAPCMLAAPSLSFLKKQSTVQWRTAPNWRYEV
jgi:hypothetical protein